MDDTLVVTPAVHATQLKTGDIAVYKDGSAFFMNQVVYVHDTESLTNKVVVCTLVGWNTPFGWGFSVDASDLTVVHHVEPPTEAQRRGWTFCPAWLEGAVPNMRKAVKAYLDSGGVLPK